MASLHHQIDFYRQWSTISDLEILSLTLIAGEEVLTSIQGWNCSEGEHLPECDPEGPDITLVTVLPVSQTLYGLPPHGDVGVGVHLIEVVGGHSRQTEVGYLNCFLISHLVINNMNNVYQYMSMGRNNVSMERF